MSGHWVGFDFDGTLATYDRTHFPEAGVPILFTCNALQDCLDAGMEVRIVTARAALQEDPDNPHYTAEDNEALLEPVRRFCREVFDQELPITAEKDFMMLRLWDDRAVQVIPNVGLPIEMLLDQAMEILGDTVEMGPQGLVKKSRLIRV